MATAFVAVGLEKDQVTRLIPPKHYLRPNLNGPDESSPLNAPSPKGEPPLNPTKFFPQNLYISKSFPYFCTPIEEKSLPNQMKKGF